MASRTRPPVRIIFAAVLKELMRQRGWTQRDLSMASGISQRQISNLVKGTQSAALDTAEAIAQDFDMKTWHMLIRTTGLPPKDLARLRRGLAAFLAVCPRYPTYKVPACAARCPRRAAVV